VAAALFIGLAENAGRVIAYEERYVDIALGVGVPTTSTKCIICCMQTSRKSMKIKRVGY